MIAINSREKPNTDMFEKLTDEEARTQIRGLAVKAQEGDINAVVDIRRLLHQHPNIYQTIGNLANHSHRAWINVIAGKNVELREMLIHRVGDLKRQLRVESTDTAIACLVIDQVVGTWLQLYYAEMRDAVDSPQSLKWAEFQLKRLESAHRRHVKSIGALATLQRLLPQASRDASGGIGEESNHTQPLGFKCGDERRRNQSDSTLSFLKRSSSLPTASYFLFYRRPPRTRSASTFSEDLRCQICLLFLAPISFLPNIPCLNSRI